MCCKRALMELSPPPGNSFPTFISITGVIYPLLSALSTDPDFANEIPQSQKIEEEFIKHFLVVRTLFLVISSIIEDRIFRVLYAHIVTICR